ncbi:MAG TPA: outer membrane lipoprotein chaperone LolA [Blastocatellia bacterium]|nr:outer membrane lipoprotein chaperone LolA [Blastocatellia bacterium]
MICCSKRLTSPAASILLSLSLLSAQSTAFAANDLSAIIDGLQKKYSRMNGLSAEFVQIYRGSDGRTVRESGQLILKRPGKARWDYTSPEKKLFVSDGKFIFFYVAGEKHASKASVRESSDPQIPFLFLLGRGNIRRDFTSIELITNERPVIAGNVVLRLFPRKAPDSFKQLLVEVSPSTFEVRRLVIFEQSGARMDFLLSNVRENFIAPDSQFSFTPPAGVSIVRAR